MARLVKVEHEAPRLLMSKHDTPPSENPLISIVVPCYNEEHVIKETTRQLLNFCDELHPMDVELIFIDDGSHVSKHIIASFKFLFDYLSEGGLYAVEDLQTSYFPRFGGSRINLKSKRTALNFLKSLTDSINYEHNDKPFYKKRKFDGLVEYIHFYQNIAILKKGKSRKIFYKDQTKEKNLSGIIKKLISKLYE